MAFNVFRVLKRHGYSTFREDFIEL